jgi:hypothetical protein
MRADANGPPRWTLSGTLAVFLLLGPIYVWQVPPFEGPDEGEHFAYITWLVEEGMLPLQGAAAWETEVRQEGATGAVFGLALLAKVNAAVLGVPLIGLLGRSSAMSDCSRWLPASRQANTGWSPASTIRWMAAALGPSLISARSGSSRDEEGVLACAAACRPGTGLCPAGIRP